MTLVRYPQLAAKLGRSGAEGVQAHYTAAKMAERTLEVFDKVLSPARRPQKAAAEA